MIPMINLPGSLSNKAILINRLSVQIFIAIYVWMGIMLRREIEKPPKEVIFQKFNFKR
jgi:hypothetical protein